MRRILLNYARDRQRQKRWAKVTQVSLSEVAAMSMQKGAELIVLDDALKGLAASHPRKKPGCGDAILWRAERKGDR